MKTSYIFLFIISSFFQLSAQYYYIPYIKAGTNPAGLNKDNENPSNGGLSPGWSLILSGPQASGNWSATFNVPFPFYFNGALVTRFKASTSGLVTFNSRTPIKVDSNNVALPSPRIPDSSICIWGLRALNGDFIVTKTFGTTPNRQFWISFNAFSEQNLKSGNIYMSVVLEETTNIIYLVDQRSQCLSNNVACADKTDLTLGIQIDSNNAYMVSGSPNYQSDNLNKSTPEDNSYFAFIPGTQPTNDVAGLRHEFVKYYKKNSFPLTVEGTFKNTGKEIINAAVYNYNINNGPTFSQNISGLNVATLQDIKLTHPTAWDISNSGIYNIKSWISLINGNPSATPGDDTIRSTINVSDTFLLRNLMHENFTSSTSNQCRTGNVIFRDVLKMNPGLSTELNYPFTSQFGGDPYYTTECADRAGYYDSLRTIPALIIDGITNLNTNAYTTSAFSELQEVPAFFQIIPSGNVKGQKIDIHIGIKTFAPLAGSVKLYIAIAEKLTTKNLKTNGETMFPHVMKKLIPDANGTTIGPLGIGVNNTYNFSWTVPGNYRLPLNSQAVNIINLQTEHSIEDFSNLEVIAWLQDTDHNILQSSSANLNYIVANENTLANKDLHISPNPVNNYFFINMTAFNADPDLNIIVYNSIGNLIYTTKTNLKSMFVNTSNWLPGSYYIRVVGKNQEASQKIIVINK